MPQKTWIQLELDEKSVWHAWAMGTDLFITINFNHERGISLG
jgi:hypothetical protein